MTDQILNEALTLDGPFPGFRRRLRLGIVGGGRISGTQAMAARLTNRWDVVAGALSSEPERAKSRGTEWFLDPDRCYASFAEMAVQEAQRPDGIDAVMITTPNHLHFAAAAAFLDAGIHVLCDKPLTNQISEADQLVEKVAQSGCVFTVGYALSCYPMVRQAKELVAEGAIGQVNQIHAEFMQDWMTPDDVGNADHVRWRLDPAKSGKTSCVGDIGTHAAHLAQLVSGLKLTRLRAEFHVCGAPKLLEDTAFLNTRYTGDIPGTLMATRLAPGNRGGLRLRIFGSEGGIEWDMEKAERLKFNRFGETDRIVSRGHGHGVSNSVERFVRTSRGFPEGLIEAWANLYLEFALAVAAKIDGQRLPSGLLQLPGVEDGRAGVRFIDASVQSDEQDGIWVTI